MATVTGVSFEHRDGEIGSPEWLDARREAAHQRAELLRTDKYGYSPDQARHIVTSQEDEIARRVSDGKPVSELIRSIELKPSTLTVLPEAELRKLEADTVFTKLKERAQEIKQQTRDQSRDRDT